MDDIFKLYFLVGFLVFLVFIAFATWIIKRSVKMAIEETLYSTEFREQIRNDIIFSIISSKRQIDNKYYERPTE